MRPRIYNLFPRLVGDMRLWPEHARRAQAMGFDWFYVNPFHYPGFSGSIYAVKDYFRIDPLLLPAEHPDNHHGDSLRADGGLDLLADVVGRVREIGLHPMMDLVINHTAFDSPLVAEHPEWYVRDPSGAVQHPSAIDPADARKVTVWGDLAELDHHHAPDREGAWDYFCRLVRRYVEIGFEGFRCDAAYKVPSELWQRLIATARESRPTATFFGETLGARLEEVESLASSGLHFIFNSSKWWDFVEPWCVEQLRSFAAIAPSVSFPESHDTPRLWHQSGGSAPIQKQRYAFAAAFSHGVLMPVGYEFGFSRPIHVVDTKAADWEEATIDLSNFIARVNAMKLSHPGLSVETVEVCSPEDATCVLLEKREADVVAWIAVNRSPETEGVVELSEASRGARVLRPCREEAAGGETAAASLVLEPAEVAYLIPS